LRLVWLLLFAACGRKTIELPALGDAASVVLLQENRELVEAHDLSLPNRRVAADDEDMLTLLLYREPLAALGLSEGALVHHDGEGGRALPDPDRAFAAEISGEWNETLADQSPLFRSFRLAPEPPAQCVARGGCYPAEELDCVRPCPAPAPPQAPRLPPAPMLLPCPAGWAEVDLDGVAICEPRPGQPETASCAAGTHPFLGGACRALTAPCAADGWPVPPPGRTVVWIRAGANGAGTRDDPVGTIDDAIAIAPPGAVLAVAAGRHVADVSLSDRELLGACADSIVEGEIDVAAGAIRALTIEGTMRVSGSLVLEEVATTGVSVDSGGFLDARGIVSSVRADAARITIAGSVLDALVLTAASATVADTLLLGETRAMGGRLVLQGSELRALTSSAGAEVFGEQVVIRGGTGTAILSEGHLTIRRAFIRAGEGNAISSSAGVVVADQILIEGGESGFSVERTNLLVTGSRIRGGTRALSAREGAEIHVDTTIVEDTSDYAFRIDGEVPRPGETYQLEDLELRGTRGGVRVLRPQIGRLSRVSMRELRGPAVYAEGTVDVVVEDLSIEAIVLACDPAASECGAVAGSGGMLDLDRFSISDADAAAVRLSAEAGAELTNGRIVRAPAGIAAFGARDPRGLLRAVIFEEVAAPCAPCGE
jgi:hypothetical protein